MPICCPTNLPTSWNGKYRRPEGLYQPEFSTAEQGGLLWVYEGMTQYLGNMLATRSGITTQAQYRDMLAFSAANLDYRSGRQWRTTRDTAVAASILRDGHPGWSNWRRGQDYYDEGELLWLDADTLIRKLTGDKKSLDDFQRIFLGKGGNTGPLIVTYNFDELVQDLNAVTPYDWATFLHDRIDKINLHADMAGIEQGGYKLVYKDKPTATIETLSGLYAAHGGGSNFWFSLGLRIGNEGNLIDVRFGGPADKARFAPGEKILAVNGAVYSPDAIKAALRAAKGATEPIHFIVQADNFVSLMDIDYHDGERYPHLERVDGTPAYLDEIIKPLTMPEKPPAEEKKEE